MTFDWTTFALQLINVLILLAILRHFLFRPVAAIIAARRAETEAALEAARASNAAAGEAAARAQAEAEASVAARAELLKTAAEEAGAERGRLLDAARAEAARIVADGEAARARQAAAETARALDQTADLAAAVAARALAAQPPRPEGYADRLAQALERMPDQDRRALLNGGNLSLVAAGDLPPAVLDRAQHALAAYGAAAVVTLDPGLIAGLDLRSDSGTLRNSLAHDLDRINKAMHDDRAPA